MEDTTGLPETVLADTGYASGKAVDELQKKGVDPLVAIGRPCARRPYDFRPHPKKKEARRITEPWRLAMKERLENTEAGNLYRLRKQTVEPVFGIIKSIMGFRRFSLRGLAKVTTGWTLVALAYNCKRMAQLQAA
ncbi:transposase [Acetobacter aceti]|uniref:transposase n=1 Tax=Acetobacter aceti TaxID=435 RepID=UPI0038D04716